MRALVGLGVVTTLGVLASAASAEPLPSASIGVQAGLLAGTGADYDRLGVGYQIGAQAAWQPMRTERRIGWSARWSFMYGWFDYANAARVDDALKELQLDLMFGIRIRPGVSPSRYVTLHVGGELLRADQVLPPTNQRAWAGGVASIGLDQYKVSSLFSLELRVSQIGAGPTMVALVLGIGKTGG